MMSRRYIWTGLALSLSAVAVLFLVGKRFAGFGVAAGETSRQDSARGFIRNDGPDEKLRPPRIRSEDTEESESNHWEPGSYEHALFRDVVNPFNQEEIAQLARDPTKKPFRLTDLIHRAAAEKDLRFRYLAGKLRGVIPTRWSPFPISMSGTERLRRFMITLRKAPMEPEEMRSMPFS